MLISSHFSAHLGAAVNEVAARVRASVVEVHAPGGTGSGTIWDRHGTIVTNHHVVSQDRARVTLEDGRRFPVQVVALDPRNDLAVLRAAAGDLPAASIGDARSLRPGELVLAVGNPAGIRGAVTVGVVNRALPQSHAGRGRELVQADVLLGPGSSGGPLVDAHGRVVGINTMVHGGLALAVPSHVIDRLLRKRGERPVLGITAQEVALPARLMADDLDRPKSALLVMHVGAGGVAERAGLLLGDLITGADGMPLEGSDGLLNALDAHAGGLLRLNVVRGGCPMDVLLSWHDAGEAAPLPRAA
jgi:serine protease Do